MKHIPKRLFIIAALFVLGAVGFAQQRGGTLQAAWAQDPVGLDPHITSAYSSFQVLENVLDTLVALDEKQNVIPSLAESWEVSEDGTTYTFQLREDVKYSNGRPLTAEDVVYTYERLLDPETASGNAYLLGGVTEIKAVDDYTVELILDAPNAALLSHLAAAPTGIIARESVENGTINTQPIGSGPFMITEFLPGISVMLERNPNYWRMDNAGNQLPYLDAVEIQIIPDDATRRSALIAGDVDWAISVPPQSVEELDERQDVVIDSTATGAYWYIGVNTEREPFDDPRVRQALSFALNRENIALAAAFGNAEPTQDPIPSSSAWSFAYDPYTFDLEQARQLLQEAGVGTDFSVEIMPTTQYEESIRAAQVIQANLAQLGVDATIRTLEWAEWLAEEGAGNYDTYVCSWNALVDPDDYYYAQHHTGEVFNFTGYSNPTVDELLEQGRRTQDFQARYDIYERINQIIVDEAPYIYLYNPLNINAYKPYVKGYSARADQAVKFVETWLDQ